MLIRRYIPEDFAAIMEIEHSRYNQPDGYDQKRMDKEINHRNCVTLVAEDCGTILGVASIVINKNTADLWNLAVRKEYEGKGIGLALLRGAVSLANKMTISLTVAVSNVRAQKIYRRFGFVERKIKPKYYSSGEDGIRMVKPRN